MRWGWFALALLVTFVVQTAVLPFAHLEFLDLLLVLALVFGLAAPVADARLAGWVVGAAQDLGTDGPMGLHAFALGLAVLALTYLREWVNQYLWWARWLAMFVVAYPAEVLIHLHQRFLQGARLTWLGLVLDPLFTAAVAALVALVVLALPGLFGRRARRRSAAARW